MLGSPRKPGSDTDSDGGAYSEDKLEINSTAVVRDRQAGASKPVQLTLCQGHKKLIVSDQEKPIAVASIKQLRTIKGDTVDADKDVTATWPLTVVYTAWGRVKQLDLEFTSLHDYDATLTALSSIVPPIPVVHLPLSLVTLAPLPIATPLSPRLPLSPRMQLFSARSADPLSPRAFGHRPGDDTTYTMPPASPRAIRRAAASSKRRRTPPACRLPCLVPTALQDDLPPVVGAGHPHLQLAAFKLQYDAGKQYDRSRHIYHPTSAAPTAGIFLTAQG